MNQRRRARIMRQRRRRRQKKIMIGAVGVLLAAGGTLLLIHCCGKKQPEEPLWNELTLPRRTEAAAPIATEPPQEEILLVNWENPIPYERPDGLVAQEEIFGSEVILQNGAGSINEEAGIAAKEMFLAAEQAGVGKYVLSNAYRSIISQEKLWQARLAEDADYGKTPFREPVKAMPGECTEHATGLALDILAEGYLTADEEYGNTAEGIWLRENAWKYGFILRYPKEKEQITGVIYEPWHYRYVGKEHAEQIHKSGQCLEEYLEKLPQQQEFDHPIRKTQAVVIDAGHGQPDDGTTGVNGTVEEELNLAIAEKLEKELERRGYLVAMTRRDHKQLSEDKDEDMEMRRRMLTDSGHDIAISIHQNYYEEDGTVSGPQVFHASGSAYGEQLAERIQKQLNEDLQPEEPRAHTVGDFYVVRSGGAPCVMVECGFLSNAQEEEDLNNADYQDRLVCAIADGVDDYF